PANRPTFERRARVFAPHPSPSQPDSCTRSLAFEFLSQNSARGPRLYFYHQQIEHCQKQREKRQPNASTPKEDKPAWMFPGRQKRLQNRGPGKQQNHRKNKGYKHGPTPGRLVSNQAA